MNRRVVISLCLLGIVGGSAGAALAAPGVTTQNHNICIQFAQNQDYQHTRYICIDTP